MGCSTCAIARPRCIRNEAQEYATYFIVMQVDRAGWHQSKDLVIPDNNRLLAQPAHNRGLNPVEHIWEELREKHFHNRVFPPLDAVEETLSVGLNRLDEDPEYGAFHDLFPAL